MPSNEKPTQRRIRDRRINAGRSQNATSQGGGGRRASKGGLAGPAIHQDSLQSLMRRWDAMNDASVSRISTRDAFQQSVWVYGAVTAIADNISEAQFRVTNNGNEADDSPLGRLIARPNKYDQQGTSNKFRRAYFIELLLSGAVLNVLGELQGAVPGTLIVYPRNRFVVSDAIDENGMLIPMRWQLTTRGKPFNFIPGLDIYHDALYNPFHDYEGISPLQAAVVGISNDISIGEFIDRFFRNDCSSGVVFSSDHPGFRQEQAEQAEAKYNEVNAGKNNWFRAKFLGFGLTPHNLGTQFDARGQQVIKQLTKEEIVTGIYKIPLEVFGSKETGSSGVTIGASSPEPAKETFIVTVVIPWARRFDENFNSDIAWRFGPGFKGEHDFTANPILERRRLDRAKQAIELIDRGVTLNTVIRWLDLMIDPQPHGDEFWIDSTKVPARFIVDAGPGGLGANVAPKSRESVETYLREIIELAAQSRTREAAAGDARRNGSPALLTAERLGLTQEQVNRLRCLEIMDQ